MWGYGQDSVPKPNSWKDKIILLGYHLHFILLKFLLTKLFQANVMFFPHIYQVGNASLALKTIQSASSNFSSTISPSVSVISLILLITCVLLQYGQCPHYIVLSWINTVLRPWKLLAVDHFVVHFLFCLNIISFGQFSAFVEILAKSNNLFLYFFKLYNHIHFFPKVLDVALSLPTDIMTQLESMLSNSYQFCVLCYELFSESMFNLNHGKFPILFHRIVAVLTTRVEASKFKCPVSK